MNSIKVWIKVILNGNSIWKYLCELSIMSFWNSVEFRERDTDSRVPSFEIKNKIIRVNNMPLKICWVRV